MQHSSVQHVSKMVIRSLCWVIALAILFPTAIAGQEVPITASLNSNHFTTDDVVVLTVTVTDDSAQQPRPILPPLAGLSVIDLGIATNVRLVNNNIQTEVIYTYKLQPRNTGGLTIPAIPVKIDDEVYTTPPMEITVSQGTAPLPSPGNAVNPENIEIPAALDGQDFFVESVVDLTTPYVGQQIIYTFRLFQTIRLYKQPQYAMPSFSGFDAVGMPVREYNLDLDGRTYLITEIRMALFPKSDGATTIGPAQMIFPGSFFEEPVEFYTEPVQIQAKPLPKNAPAGFKGAVGSYSIEAWLSPDVAIVNQPATLHIAVTGSGNIPNLPEPIWPHLGRPGYDPLATMSTTMEDDILSGTRVFEQLVLLDRVGKFNIPPAEMVFFDPAAQEYRKVVSEALPVEVIPPPTPDPATATAVAAAAIPQSMSTPLPFNRQPVNPFEPDSPNLGWGLLFSMGLLIVSLACVAVPMAVGLGAGGFWLWQRSNQPASAMEVNLAADDVLQVPNKQMHPALARAMQNKVSNYRIVSLALESYLSQLLDAPVMGLTRNDLGHQLQRRGLTPEQVSRVKDYLNQSEIGHYGPQPTDAGWGLLVQADELLSELDRTVGVEAKTRGGGEGKPSNN